MAIILPKGHLSSLSQGFRYTPAHLTDIAQTLARIRSELMGHLQPLSQTRWTPVAGRANLSPLALPDGDAQRIGIPGGKRRITALRAASGRGQK